MEIDSGVCPGVSRVFRRTRPNSTDFAIAKRRKRVFRFGCGAEINRCADAIAQFQMSRDEIGVEMRQEYVLDLEPVLGGEGDVLIRVPLRVDDGCCAGFLVAD